MRAHFRAFFGMPELRWAVGCEARLAPPFELPCEAGWSNARLLPFVGALSSFAGHAATGAAIAEFAPIAAGPESGRGRWLPPSRRGTQKPARNASAKVEHEATTAKISEDQLFYCLQRGMNEEEAVALIVNGFCREVMQQLPMEFAVEAQKLVGISLEGSVG